MALSLVSGTIAFIFVLLWSLPTEAAEHAPVEVFLMVGQSNMQGKGSVEMLAEFMKEPLTKPIYDYWLNKTAAPTNGINDPLTYGFSQYDSVQVYFPDLSTERTFPLTPGLGIPAGERFGPELEFGRIMFQNANFNHDLAKINERITEETSATPKVLIIKAAWGGVDLAVDFRPPSRGLANYTNWDPSMAEEDAVPRPAEDYGAYYQETLKVVSDALQRVTQGEVFPDVTTYSLKGMVWWQGWNDLIFDEKVTEYEENLRAFFVDLRKDLGVPDLPVVVGQVGQHGISAAEFVFQSNMMRLRRSQRAVAQRFHHSMAHVSTGQYYVEDPAGGYDDDFHYYGRADTFFFVGRVFGETMVELLQDIYYEEKEKNSS